MGQRLGVPYPQPPYRYVRRPRPSRTSTWGSSTCSPTSVRFELRREQLYLASVHHRGPGRGLGELSVRRVGLPWRSGDKSRPSVQDRQIPDTPFRVYNDATLGEEADSAGDLVGVLFFGGPRRRRNLERVSSQHQYVYNGQGLEQGHHHAADAILHRRQERQAARRSAGSRRPAKTPTTRAASRTPAPPGSPRW